MIGRLHRVNFSYLVSLRQDFESLRWFRYKPPDVKEIGFFPLEHKYKDTYPD